MINVSSGHEKGIGIEVFLKSFLLLSSKNQRLFKLFINKSVLKENLEALKLNYTLSANECNLAHSRLNVEFIDQKPFSTSSFLAAIKSTGKKDILLTLPTTKDQLILNDTKPAGHTEYFRKMFERNISMFFKSESANVLLISDHIPLKQVSSISENEIIEQISTTLHEKEKYFFTTNEVIIAGINPHAGEGGILGNEDSVITSAISKLQKTFPEILFRGPLPADSLLINNEFHDSRLFVYMYHDQGLAPFKSLFKTKGANISFGLPFLRLSVDHGTAFDLYGKNSADYMGCSYVLKEAIKAHVKIG